MSWKPEKGDWVAVKALVTKPDPHPEEFTVRFESHNEHFYGVVRRDMCSPTGPPEWLPDCNSLHDTGAKGTVLAKCELHSEHSGQHRGAGMEWPDSAEYGRLDR